MDSKSRLDLITGAAQEVVGVEHLESRIADGGTIRAYVGFEPSGKAHVGWKVLATNLLTASSYCKDGLCKDYSPSPTNHLHQLSHSMGPSTQE